MTCVQIAILKTVYTTSNIPRVSVNSVTVTSNYNSSNMGVKASMCSPPSVPLHNCPTTMQNVYTQGTITIDAAQEVGLPKTTFLSRRPRIRHPSDSRQETLVLRRRPCGLLVYWWRIRRPRTCIRAGRSLGCDDRRKLVTALDVRREDATDSPTQCICNINQCTHTAIFITPRLSFECQYIM